jgi:hypothetical protein
LEKKRKTREEAARRIRESLVIKREEKKNEQRSSLEKLERILAVKDSQPEHFKIELQIMEIESLKDLEKQIKDLKLSLGLISKKDLVGLNVTSKEGEKYQYIKIPDSELTAQQLRVKRMQIMHQQAAEQKLQRKEEKAKKLEEIQQMKLNNPLGYLATLYEKRKVRFGVRLERQGRHQEDQRAQSGLQHTQKEEPTDHQTDRLLLGNEGGRGRQGRIRFGQTEQRTEQ